MQSVMYRRVRGRISRYCWRRSEAAVFCFDAKDGWFVFDAFIVVVFLDFGLRVDFALLFFNFNFNFDDDDDDDDDDDADFFLAPPQKEREATEDGRRLLDGTETILLEEQRGRVRERVEEGIVAEDRLRLVRSAMPKQRKERRRSFITRNLWLEVRGKFQGMG